MNSAPENTVHPACKLCKGACCECIMLPWESVAQEDRDWFALHGRPFTTGVDLSIPCSKFNCLTGRCTIYETRPETCKKFAVGSPGCRLVIAVRREPQWA